MNKTKVMISGERQMAKQKDVKWLCGVCSKGVGSNSIQSSSCQKWVHKKCSGIKGSMSKVANSFICRGCLNPVTSAGRTHTHTFNGLFFSRTTWFSWYQNGKTSMDFDEARDDGVFGWQLDHMQTVCTSL